jgi:transcriptional repressor NrdR
MHCPFCQTEDTKVIDSRCNSEGDGIRRRRECTQCAERFTTYEVLEALMPYVVKRDGSRVAFDKEKLQQSMLKALHKRPISVEQVEQLATDVIRRMRDRNDREVSSQLIGEWIMEMLKKLDKVAYVRFASVYKDFEDIDAFKQEIQQLNSDDV